MVDERVAFPSPGHLQLYNLTMADAGEYQCIASNEGGSTTYTCKLSIENGEIKNLMLPFNSHNMLGYRNYQTEFFMS